MKLRDRQLQTTIQRFFDGETTVREERALFAAFAPGRNVPADLEQYREMMQWYATMSGAAAIRGRKRPRFAVWSSAAAAVAMIAVVAVSYVGRAAAFDRECLAYAGSYVIRNGVKDTDIKRILPEIKNVNTIVSRQQAIAAGSAVTAMDVTEPVVLSGVDMDDPRVKEMIELALGSKF